MTVIVNSHYQSTLCDSIWGRGLLAGICQETFTFARIAITRYSTAFSSIFRVLFRWPRNDEQLFSYNLIVYRVAFYHKSWGWFGNNVEKYIETSLLKSKIFKFKKALAIELVLVIKGSCDAWLKSTRLRLDSYRIRINPIGLRHSAELRLNFMICKELGND